MRSAVVGLGALGGDGLAAGVVGVGAVASSYASTVDVRDASEMIKKCCVFVVIELGGVVRIRDLNKVFVRIITITNHFVCRSCDCGNIVIRAIDIRELMAERTDDIGRPRVAAAGDNGREALCRSRARQHSDCVIAFDAAISQCQGKARGILGKADSDIRVGLPDIIDFSENQALAIGASGQ